MEQLHAHFPIDDKHEPLFKHGLLKHELISLSHNIPEYPGKHSPSFYIKFSLQVLNLISQIKKLIVTFKKIGPVLCAIFRVNTRIA